jgi:hypothetical protein
MTVVRKYRNGGPTSLALYVGMLVMAMATFLFPGLASRFAVA